MLLMEKVRGAFNASWSTIQGISPYLGSGGFGDVYRVQVEGEQLALKVSKDGHMKAEFDTLKDAYVDKAPVVQVLCYQYEDAFSAYTMKPVGTPITNLTRVIVPKLFRSLFMLHSFGWYHGNARWQNAIKSDGELLWCDFLSAKKFQPLQLYYRAYDLQKLVESVLKSKRIAPVPGRSEIEGMLQVPLTDYNNIANLVLEAMSKGRPPKH